MDQEMKDNLQDLRDIRKQMDQYYGIGQDVYKRQAHRFYFFYVQGMQSLLLRKG